MKLKRFLLALIAASMSLAGCGKKNKTSEPTEEPAPSHDVDPGDEGHEEDPPEEHKEEEQDELTPEQRENANSIQRTVELVLGLSKRYDDETIEEMNEYSLAYSEEVALEGIEFARLTTVIIDAMTLDINDPKAIVDFAIGVQQKGVLREISYVGVAVAKSMLRAESVSNLEYGEAFTYVADYLDEEGIELHSNVYGLLDSILGCAGMLMGEQLSSAIAEVYDAETKQVSEEKVENVLFIVGSALMQFSMGYESTSYLANLLVNGLVGYARDVLELDEESLEFIEKFDVQSIIDSIYTVASTASLTFMFLPYLEDNPLPHLVELINLVLAEEYTELVMYLIDDVMSKMGIDTLTWLSGLVSVSAIVQSPIFAINNIIDIVSKGFVDEETGKYSAELLLAMFVNSGEELDWLAEMGRYAVTFDKFLMVLVAKTLVIFGNYEEEEADAVASKLDVTNEIKEIYGCIGEAGEFIGSVDPLLIEIVVDLLNKEYEELAKDLLVYVGYEGELEDVEDDFGVIGGAVMAIVGHFSSEEFALELAEVYDKETGEIDLEKAKAIIVEVADTLSLILEVKENVLNIYDFVTSALKLTFIKCGMDEKEAEELFVNFDVEELFEGIETVVDTIYDAGETEKYDVYLTLVKDLAEIFSGEEEKEWDEEFSEVVAVLCAFIGEFFEIAPAKMESVESALNTPVKINEIVELYNMYSGGEGSFLDFFIEIDPETGAKTVKDMSVALILALVSGLSYSFADLANDWIVTVEVFEEVVGKVSEDADVSAQCTELEEFFGSIQSDLMSVYNYLSDYENIMTLVAKIVSYGNLALEGEAIVEEIKEGHIDTYKIAEYVCRVISMFVEAEHNEYEITSFDEIDEVVAEALPMEEIAACIEAGESNVFEDSEAVIGLKEDEGVYYIEVTLVNHYEVEIVEGEIVSTSVEVEVYAFAVPGLELLAQLLPGQEAVEVVPVEG